SLAQELCELVFRAAQRLDTARPRAVQAREREGRELTAEDRRVGRERGGDSRDLPISVTARDLAQQIDAERQTAGEPSGLESLPQTARRPQRVALEGAVRGRVDGRDRAVQLVDELSHFRKFTLDFPPEMLHVGWDLDASALAQHHEHRVQRLGSPAKLRALRELVQDASPGRGRARKQRERAPAQHVLLEAIGLAELALAEQQHAKVASRQYGSGGERPQ